MNNVLRRINTPPAKLLAATLVLALAGGFTLTSANAAPPGGGMYGGHGPMAGGPMMGGPGHMGRMLDVVNATAEQKAQIKQIMDSARTDTRAQHDSLKTLRTQQQQLFTQTTVDANAAEALRVQMSALHDQVSKRMLQAMIESSRVLTPDQRKQLAERMTEMRSRMERHRNP